MEKVEKLVVIVADKESKLKHGYGFLHKVQQIIGVIIGIFKIWIITFKIRTTTYILKQKINASQTFMELVIFL